MKIRIGFVSNSSGSSFVLNKEYLTEEQIEAILDCNDKFEDYWDIEVTDNKIHCDTIMDNGDMGNLLKELNIGLKAIEGELEL